MGRIYAFFTADRVKGEATVKEYAKLTQQTEEEVRERWEDDSDFDANSDTIRLEIPMEESGWIDRGWSRTTLYDNRNDVDPAVNCEEDDEDLEEEVLIALGWLEGGYEDGGDGTFYAIDSYRPRTEAWSYTYALHFKKKEFVNDKWTETPWHPARDGGITLL